MKKKPARRVGVFRRLAALYDRMGKEYASVANQLNFDCMGCKDNCCISYFQHHTYIEWVYLWKGMMALPDEQRLRILRKAEEYVRLARAMVEQGQRPMIMCPIIQEDGLCGLYEHRLMICRMHGTAHTLKGRDGEQRFPGCPRFEKMAPEENAPYLDRTPLYQELAKLEMEFMGAKMGTMPKVDLTLAEMLVLGPPEV